MPVIKTVCVACLCLVFIMYCWSDRAVERCEGSYASVSTIITRTRVRLTWRVLHVTAGLMLPVLLWILKRLEPLMLSRQWNLRPPLDLWKDPLVDEYHQIFSYFDFSVLPVPTRGPKRNTTEVYAKVFLIKVQEKLQYASEVRKFFFDHPQLIPVVGFYPEYTPHTGVVDIERTLVSERHFRRKLQTINNQHLKRLLKQTVDQLDAQGLLKGTAIADTTEILAWVKENNLKQRVDNRFDKTRHIKGFPDCSLGAKPVPGEKDRNGKPKVRYFWGAKQAALVEPTAYGPVFLYEEVFTAKTADVKTALPTLKPLVEHWGYRLKKFLADAAYDAFEIYRYVYAKDTPAPTRKAAEAYIALNSRGHTRLNHQFSEHGNLICEAGLEMTNGGRWFDAHKGYHRQKFTCPLTKRSRKQTCGTCPINHTAFQKTGCYRYINLDDQDQLRFKIHRNSQDYKNTFTQRICVEQAFSAIKEPYDIEMPKVRNLHSVANIYTIAAILNNVHVLQKAPSQNTKKSGEEDPQSLGILRI